jgi:hypothetical protein
LPYQTCQIALRAIAITSVSSQQEGVKNRRTKTRLSVSRLDV